MNNRSALPTSHTPLWTSRPHAMRLVRTAVPVAVLLAAGTVALRAGALWGGRRSPLALPAGAWSLIGWGGVGLLILAAALGLLGWLTWRATVYTLTPDRLMVQTGWLGQRAETIPLAKINNLSARTSLWGRLWGYGTLVIETGNDAADRWDWIPAPHNVTQLYQDQLAHLAPPLPPSASDSGWGRRDRATAEEPHAW